MAKDTTKENKVFLLTKEAFSLNKKMKEFQDSYKVAQERLNEVMKEIVELTKE